MISNFNINQSVYIVHNDRYYDLHNDYRFTQLDLFTPDKNLSLKWIKREAEWVNKENAKEIKLIFKNVGYLQISPHFLNQSEDRIEEIGFKDAEDYDLDWLNFAENRKPLQHILLRFANDEFIRVYSDEIIFEQIVSDR